MAVHRGPLPLLPTVDMGDAKFLLGRRRSTERRHIALDGDCVRQVAADPGGEKFPRIVTYRRELRRDPIKRLCHAFGATFAQSPSSEERDGRGVSPESVVRCWVPVVKRALRIDEAREEVTMKVLDDDHGDQCPARVAWAAMRVVGLSGDARICRCRGGTSEHAAHSAGERNARTAWLTGAKMVTVEVTVEHFLDAGEQAANGDWDYFYEGDLFTFSADTNSHGAILKARIYSDTPTRASFIEQRVKLETSPLTDEAVAYLRSRGATEIHCLGPVGYGVWSSAD